MVKGACRHRGNEMADQQAKEAARNKNIEECYIKNIKECGDE